MAQESTFFQQQTSTHAILLIDASSSTTNVFPNGVTIFDRILCEIIALPHETFNLLFWNSDNVTQFFNNGVKVIDATCTKKQVETWFKLVQPKISNGCCTMPHLGFAAVPASWYKNTCTVYFITDGEISTHTPIDTYSLLTAEIKKLANVNLHIITVENNDRDLRKVDEQKSAAGSDVYNLIKSKSLTSCVCSFVSYNTSGKYVQIQKTCNMQPGQIPYGDMYFTEQHTSEFISWLSDRLASADSDEQVAIVQKLAVTIHYLSLDKPIRFVSELITMFSRMFSTDMKDIAKQMLTDTVENELAGKAEVFADLRARRRDLFAMAAHALKQNVANAIGLDGIFITSIVNDRVLIGPARLASGSSTYDYYKYLSSSYKGLAVFPCDVRGELSSQCTRQWVRLVFSNKYRCNIKDDTVIYLVMAELARVNVSGDDAAVKYYKALARTMLEKKRLNSADTEYSRLLRGEFPTPNSGVVAEFNRMMEFVARKFQLTASPMQMWKLLCVAMPELYAAQNKYFDKEQLLIISLVTIDHIPLGTGYDYSCIITLVDISATGGYSIRPHTYGNSNMCAITYTLSAEGKDQLLASGRCVCPICYTRLSADDFVLLPPYSDFVLPAAYGVEQKQQQPAERPAEQKQQQPAERPAEQKQSQFSGTVVVLKGTVGCGKSTYSANGKRLVEERGGQCLVINTDVYSRNKMDFTTQIIPLICDQLIAFKANDCKDKVVIVDTCGERDYGKTLFTVDFSSWKFITVYVNLDRSDVSNYLAWSLRNVLLRGESGPNDSFWLTPANFGQSGIHRCKKIHRQKAAALGLERYWKFDHVDISGLSVAANAYAEKIRPVYEF